MSYAQVNNETLPLRAGNYDDTIKVLVPLKYIKLANGKLIERKHLLTIVKQQDSIIGLKNLYINEQKTIINNYHIELLNSNRAIDNIKKDIEKKNQQIKTLTYTTVGVICVTVLAIIL